MLQQRASEDVWHIHFYRRAAVYGHRAVEHACIVAICCKREKNGRGLRGRLEVRQHHEFAVEVVSTSSKMNLKMSASAKAFKQFAAALQNAHLQVIRDLRSRNTCLIFLQSTNEVSLDDLVSFIVFILKLERD